MKMDRWVTQFYKQKRLIISQNGCFILVLNNMCKFFL